MVRHTLTTEISQLAASLGRDSRPLHGAAADGPSATRTGAANWELAGPDGHRCESSYRGTACAGHTPSPVGGMPSGRNLYSSSLHGSTRMNLADSGHAPRAKLPQFDGSNPKLWQRRCEDYFQRWQTPSA